MTFLDLFKDDNDINEKSIIGFVSFFVMLLFALADIITSLVSNTELEISTTIYSSFVVVTLGSFGISEAGKYFIAKTKQSK